MEQVSIIILILMILGQNPEGQTTVDTMTSSKLCEGETQCKAVELGCTQAGSDAVERVYRNKGKDVAQYLCARISLTDNN